MDHYKLIAFLVIIHKIDNYIIMNAFVKIITIVQIQIVFYAVKLSLIALIVQMKLIALLVKAI